MRNESARSRSERNGTGTMSQNDMSSDSADGNHSGGHPPMRVTRIGGPTALIEFDGWRILTDPTFDPPGRRYGFGLGTSSMKTAGPAISSDNVGPIDAVLLSHDHHADNLDDSGRESLANAPAVFTTRSGQRRLGTENVIGLAPWQTADLTRADGARLTVTATPCRHGPPFSHPIIGDVIGFALSHPGQGSTTLWMSGDTVDFRGITEVARRLDIDVALIHMGAVRFPITGRLAYSLDSRHAVRVLQKVQPRVALPVHYEGWSHFSEPEARLHDALDSSPVKEMIVWLPLGVATPIPGTASLDAS